MSSRHQLGRNLNELERKAQELADWRTHYRRNPTVLLGFALGGGFLLGALARRGRSPRHQNVVEAPAATRAQGRTSRQIEHTLSSVSDALLGVASAKVMAFVGSLVPGFSEQINRPQAGAGYDQTRFTK
jgi:hypothetical protein